MKSSSVFVAVVLAVVLLFGGSPAADAGNGGGGPVDGLVDCSDSFWLLAPCGILYGSIKVLRRS